ncbi:maleylpyruvate isomerase N-terminal domain-containing protein [Nocardioides sp. CFH 31398]|uniref:maleylpyruvate isomerase N-terminal domain-containing protein n=1 Tax=Nocardioides sp. CFH 31398 TaxID=2919579 RepID=UPI001F05369E|nr:maleylpyruvate isomerase N-terminal domain-containing protein [Nocardioides sp. CFH 31398]MCH1865943.1 maleylpyruvate isomerase N-terminal domain-containing protein [Nocardioides sp. CFH 31398]
MSPGVLVASYDALSGVLDGLVDADWERPTRAEGWSVRDLTFHLLLDAQRALVTLASPGERAPDRDRFDYWRDFHPEQGDGGAGHAALVRRVAAAYGERALLALWRDTAPAASHAVTLADQADLVATQGHVLTVADLASTLVVEATVHHLDLVVDLPDAPGPPVEGLAETRRVLDVLRGVRFPEAWGDERVALLGTGRVRPDAAEGEALGDAGRPLPLLG